MARKLLRSNNNRVISGVCGGIAEYFSTDATLIRLVCAAFALTGTGIVAYIIAAIIIPAQDRGTYQADEYDPEKDFRDFTMEDSKEHYSDKGSQERRTIFGIVLIAIGAMIFAQRFFDWFKAQYMLPLILVIIGVGIIYKGGRK